MNINKRPSRVGLLKATNIVCVNAHILQHKILMTNCLWIGCTWFLTGKWKWNLHKGVITIYVSQKWGVGQDLPIPKSGGQVTDDRWQVTDNAWRVIGDRLWHNLTTFFHQIFFSPKVFFHQKKCSVKFFCIKKNTSYWNFFFI